MKKWVEEEIRAEVCRVKGGKMDKKKGRGERIRRHFNYVNLTKPRKKSGAPDRCNESQYYTMTFAIKSDM